MRTNLVNLLIVLVVYLNASALLPSCGIRLPRYGQGVAGPLPNHWATHKLFQLFGVFSSTSSYCHAFAAFGAPDPLPEVPQAPLPDMIDLDIDRYFPQSRGEANQRIALWGYRDDRERRRRAYRRMAEVIQRLHNRAHPETPVAQVFIYRHRWPKSELGFEHHRAQRTTRLLGHN